ncbi:MAG TPA: sugar phosphate nucleotidyltransferase [Candidatus Dormibacteraeota bacterium]|jgi:glucose-1-phosphate cytidylyltransferase|nr:sugar phosphate nucleotidyltransferase [Candidatus Dormibacteraeota bacterium]
MKVLILCGGVGTRAYPLTKKLPKALMMVAGLPIIEQVMSIYASQGFNEFVLAAGYLQGDIRRYFRGRPKWDVEILDTGDATDTGGRVRASLDRLGDTFHATYCDGLGDVDLERLVALHRSHGGPATVTAAQLRSQYGILEADEEGRVTGFVEKPVLPDHWMNAGFFVLDKEAIAAVEGENLERDILPALAAAGRLRVYQHYGFWRSMDTHKDQLELDVLWAPHALDFQTPHAVTGEVPEWLVQRSAFARGLAT